MNRRAFVLAASLSVIVGSEARAETDVMADAFNKLSMSSRLAAQEKLAMGGFYNGKLDGAFGPGTRSALVNTAMFIKDNSYGKVVFDLTAPQEADLFLSSLTSGDLDKYLWGEADESEGG